MIFILFESLTPLASRTPTASLAWSSPFWSQAWLGQGSPRQYSAELEKTPEVPAELPAYLAEEACYPQV